MNNIHTKSYVSSLILVLCLNVGLVFDASAISANPNPIEVEQLDGTVVTLRLKGDEWFHWYEDLNGFTVVRDGDTFFYARIDNDGDLAATAFIVGAVDPAVVGLTRNTMPTREHIIDQIVELQRSSPVPIVPPRAIPTTGTIDNIVILLRFSDHVARLLPTNGNMGTLFNAVGGDPTYAPTGSVGDVYYDNSYGAFTLDSTIYGWVDVPNTEAYYANGTSGGDSKVWELIIDGLNGADSLINFSNFDSDSDGFVDAIAFIHSGYGAEWGGTSSDGAASADRIWSHKWQIPAWTSAEGVKVSTYHISPGIWGTSGSAIGRIGVICHETGHFLGLPDLYDYSTGSGIGSWGMMANSWGFDGTQLHPPNFSGWSKTFLNWSTPTVITTPGAYALAQSATNNAYYKITQGFPANEYLLIENRQAVGLESAITQGGLVIFHIDDNAPHNNPGYPGQAGWPTNGNHYRVAVLQADGDYDLEKNSNRGDSGDAYHNGAVSTLGPSTVPNTNAYQGGTIIDTLNLISSISASSSNMTFGVSFGDDLSAAGGPLSSSGKPGGPFTPSSENITLLNTGGSSVSWNVTVADSWLTASPSSGTISAGGNEVVTLSITAAADSLEGGTYASTATFQNASTSFDIVVNASLEVDVSLYSFNMDSDPGWTTTGDWAFGVPTGQGSGSGDPTSGATGSNVYGYNLNGDYPDNLAVQSLTTETLDFTNMTDVTLEFKRWLGIESSTFDNASVLVSNGGAWNVVWLHNTGTFSESSWSTQVYDISSVADGQAAVQVRWTMGTTDFSVTYPGWNIDDVKFQGTDNSGPSPDSLSEAWVDFANTGSLMGTQTNPLNAVSEAITALVSGGTMKIKGDTGDSQSDETFTGGTTISKPMNIEAMNGTVQIGASAP